jgi:hypothetical protein
MTYDILALHADKAEREKICQERRLGLLGIGIITGLMSYSYIFLGFVNFCFVDFAFYYFVYDVVVFVNFYFCYFVVWSLFIIRITVDRQLRGESR